MSTENKKAIILAVIGIIALGFLIYGNTLNGIFIWDDEALVQNNEYIRNFSHLSKMFSRNIAAGSRVETAAYRPLQILSYAFDYNLWHLDPKGYHLTNIILHILVGLSLFWLLNMIFDDLFISFLASILFIVHPLHTAAVAYISGRADCLVFLWVLFCFIFYLHYLRKPGPAPFLLMLLSYAFALLSRENSLIVPVLLLVYHFSFKKKPAIKPFCSLLALAILYIILRLSVLSHIMSADHETVLAQRIPGVFVAIFNYFKLLILPLALHMEYANRVFGFSEPRAILGLLLFSGFLILGFRTKKNIVSFSILWFFAALLPLSNIYPINAYMAEHWLYMPSMGFFLILAAGLKYFYQREKLRIVSILLSFTLLGFWSYLTIKQNRRWKDPLLIYKQAALSSPDNWRAYFNLAGAYKNSEQYQKAISLYKKAIGLNPDYADAYNNLGQVYFALGKNDQALAAYKKALEIDPGLIQAYYNIGVAYLTDKPQEAIKMFKKALEIDPGYVRAHNNLGAVYYATKRYKEAIASFEKAIELDPGLVQAYSGLCYVYYRMGRFDLALEYYKKAKSLGFFDPQIEKAFKNYKWIRQDS
ncbi:MAG: tetratricopeptide repeat protein [Candidatus Omnitrophica bacterium]|nr:tetratricopeptide repeat protein [Candidatus Omnitrophota bacterium]